MKFFREYFACISACVERVDTSALMMTAEALTATRQRNGKVVLAGNGGSAAMASHVAVDLTKVAGVRAVNFNESDLITCFANDYGYEHWIARALEFYADAPDLVVLISSSGRSPNIVNAAHKARQMRLPLVTFSGFDSGNPLRQLGNVNFWVESESYNVIEMTHHIWLLSLADKLAADRISPA